MGQNYSPVLIGPDEEVKKEKLPSNEEFLNSLNRDDMIEFFQQIDSKSYKKSIRSAQRLIRKFMKEDEKLNLLRAFFILTLFNIEDYTFYREMYDFAVRDNPGCQIRLADVYYASLVLSRNKTYESRIESLAPYVKKIVDKIVSDVRETRSQLKEKSFKFY